MRRSVRNDGAVEQRRNALRLLRPTRCGNRKTKEMNGENSPHLPPRLFGAETISPSEEPGAPRVQSAGGDRQALLSNTDMSDALAVARALAGMHAGVCIPDYEKALTQAYHRFLARMSEQRIVIFDVGAHTGQHLDYFARLAHHVVAFEPVPAFASALARRFAEFNVDIREVALGRAPAQMTFHHLPKAAGMSGLRTRHDVTQTSVETINVQVDSLDRQAAGTDCLTYLKIDIEGGEVDCLSGGRDTITRHRPLISVEYGEASYAPYGHNVMTLFDLAADMGYVLSDLFGNLIETEREWRAICDTAYWDYFLVPTERIQDWRRYFAY
ncbi:MAG: FkbM family methyltransferase [Xanthobacteraceae bacterium]